MHFPTITFAMLLPALALAGSAIVHNNCQQPVYLWSVGAEMGPKISVESGKEWSETYRSGIPNGGISIKITAEDNGIFFHRPELDFAYSWQGPIIWYDASDVNGDPFDGKPVTIAPTDGSGPVISWPNGVKPPGTQPADTSSDKDVKLTLCG